MGERISIVEDGRAIADLLAMYVESSGFEVARATNVQDAIRTNAQFRPDLILLDIGLPGGNENGEDVWLPLTPTEFDLRTHMARQPRRAFSRSELLEAVAPESDAYDRVVDSHLSKLGHKLTASGCTNIIESVRDLGYQLWPES